MICRDCGINLLKIDQESCAVCPECGITERYLTIDSKGFGENVHICVYSRTKRFETMLRSLLYPAFDHKDTTVFEFLSKQKYDTLQELQMAMKKSGAKEKRFHSLHLFTKLLCKDYKPIQPPPIEFFRRVMVLFDEVLTRFNAERKHNFFSYPWLMQRLLNLLGETRYNPYIKQIRCKKRVKHYEKLYERLVKNAPASYLIRECGT